jgi:hypothetical protein
MILKRGAPALEYYSGFLDAILPRNPSACGLCLKRGHPQHFTVSKKFFGILGAVAPLVTDGILLPWKAEETRGTIFLMAHDRKEAFDENDARLMTLLADFAGMGYRQQKPQARSSSRHALRPRHKWQINSPMRTTIFCRA